MVHVPELKKPNVLAMSWSCATFTLRSEKELPDEITRAER
jgi:hypothetical protein